MNGKWINERSRLNVTLQARLNVTMQAGMDLTGWVANLPTEHRSLRVQGVIVDVLNRKWR